MKIRSLTVLLAVVILSSGCASFQRVSALPTVDLAAPNAIGNVRAALHPDAEFVAPLDFAGKLRQHLAKEPNFKAFVLADLRNAYALAVANKEPDGITCMPTLIQCVEDGCGGDAPLITGVFSAKEAALVGISIRDLIIPPKLHHDCAAWANDAAIARMLLGALQ